MNHRQTAGLLPGVGNGAIRPINVSSVEVGDVGLRTAEMPAEFIEILALGILLPLDDSLMLHKGDGTFGLELHRRPEALGNDRPRQPVHCQTKIVQLPQVNIRADGSGFQAGEQLLGLRFENDVAAD